MRIPTAGWKKDYEALGMRIFCWSGAHNPEWATSIRLCHDVFTEQYIFRTVLARILNTFEILQTSQQNLYRPKNGIFCLLITFSFPF